ncbi:MAG: DinB family protein, partial [Acidobacteriota bacterium]
MTAQAHQGGQLDQWIQAYEAARDRAGELVGGLSHEQINFRPAPKAWSVAQCLDHLAVSIRVYLDPLEPIVERARAAGQSGGEPYGRGPFMGRFLIRSLKKPGKRYPAPKSFRPRGGELDAEAVRAELAGELRRLQNAAEQCKGLALGEIRMPWPAFRPVKLSLAQAFELQAIHLHRHLDQA